ncbi:hypothetical protein DH2020_004129 [Rehmannia glutinosa]|uniref:F-box domain-containing protein n=1 Tax=Rehmannia glutinosa TaxID=99300 RepID=A0ABR0XNQ7_REHGL
MALVRVVVNFTLASSIAQETHELDCRVFLNDDDGHLVRPTGPAVAGVARCTVEEWMTARRWRAMERVVAALEYILSHSLSHKFRSVPILQFFTFKLKLDRSAAATGCGNNNDVSDRMSQLPDDILISIISRLTLREATITSILSTRWRHLYTNITRLVFPPFEEQRSLCVEYLQQVEEKTFPDYIKMIDRILDSHNSSHSLKEFRICIPDFKGANIERWLEFALTRAVEIVDIRMTYYLNAEHWPYAFLLSTLITNKNGNLPSFKSLKELRLCNLDVDDGEIEILVSNFTLLECLSIERCRKLRNVSVVGHNSMLKLKHLDICSCGYVESVHVANLMNLVSLRCCRLRFTYVVLLDNVPNLVKFNTCDQSRNTFDLVLSRFPSYILDQLLHLQLEITTLYIRDIMAAYMVPKLVNVRHLELQYNMGFPQTFKLVPLIEACPLLEKLEVTFSWSENRKFENRELYENFYPKKSPNKHLKQVRFSGYVGCPYEQEFALYIIKKAVALEQLIVEPLGPDERARHSGVRTPVITPTQHRELKLGGQESRYPHSGQTTKKLPNA